MTIETLDNVHIIDLYGCHCCWIKNSRAVAVSISHANPPRKKLSCSLPPFIFRFFLFLSLSISFSFYFLSLSFFLFLPFSLTCCPPLPFFTLFLSLSFFLNSLLNCFSAFWLCFATSPKPLYWTDKNNIRYFMQFWWFLVLVCNNSYHL